MAEVWIVRSQVARQSDGQTHGIAAVIWAAGQAGAIEALNTYLGARGHQLGDAPSVILASDPATDAGLSPQIEALFHTVNAQNPVALGELSGIDGAAPSFLITGKIEGVEPLDKQAGVHPRKFLPDVMVEPMFGQSPATPREIEILGQEAAKAPLKTYAILDGVRAKNLAQLLPASGLAYRCLFKGIAAEEYEDSAPYIVELEPENSLTRLLFTHIPDFAPELTSAHLWQVEPGICFRSRADIEALWRHFRKFTKVQDETGKWFYFRFWESRVFPIWLGAVASDINLLSYIFGPVSSFVVATQAEVLRLEISALAGKPIGQPNVLSAQTLQAFDAAVVHNKIVRNVGAAQAALAGKTNYADEDLIKLHHWLFSCGFKKEPDIQAALIFLAALDPVSKTVPQPVIDLFHTKDIAPAARLRMAKKLQVQTAMQGGSH